MKCFNWRFHTRSVQQLEGLSIGCIEKSSNLNHSAQVGKKLSFWCAIHANIVLDPSSFNNELSTRDDFHHILKTYIAPEDQKLPKKYIFNMMELPVLLDLICEFFQSLISQSINLKLWYTGMAPNACILLLMKIYKE